MDKTGGLYFEGGVDVDKLYKEIDRMNREIKHSADNFNTQGGRIDNSFKRIAQAAGVYLSFDFAGRMAREITSVRGEWQKYEAVLTNTLGSNTEAVEVLDMIAKYGATTSFQVNELTDSFVKLASQGFKPTRDQLASLGDLAASKAKGFDQLAEAIIDAETFEFERLKEFGIRASKDGEKITFTFKGVKTAVDASAESVRNYILSLGQLEGVRGSTEAISKTIVGLASNFQDAMDQMLNSLGKDQEGLIADTIKAGTDLVQNYEVVIDTMRVLVATYGAYKAASIVAVVLKEIDAAGSLASALRKTALAQHLLNTAQKANPAGMALAAITAVIGGYALWESHIKKAGAFTSELNKEITDEIIKLDSLFKALKSSGEGTEQRADAIKLVNDRYGDYLKNLLTEKSTLEDIETAQRNATNALIANISVQKSKEKLSEVLGDVSEKFDDEFSDFVSKFGEVYGTDRIPEFVVAINDAIDEKIKAGGGQVERGMLEYSDIAKNVYDQFVKDISQKTGFLKYDFKSFQDSFLDFAKFKADKSGFIGQLEGMIAAYQGIVNKLKKEPGGSGGTGSEDKSGGDLKKQISELYKDLETADEKDREIIAARILVLQQELMLREKIAENAVKALRDEPVPVKIKPIQATVNTKQTGKADSKSLIDWIAVFGDLDRLSTDALIDLRDKLKKYLSQIDDDISKEDFKEITDAFNAINDSIETRTPFDTISDSVADLKYFNAKVELQKKIVEQKKQEGASTEEILRAEKDLLSAQNGRAESLAKITKGINQIGRDGSELVSAIREYTDMLENFGLDIGDQGREIVDGVGQIMNGLESIDLTKPFSIITGTIKAVAGFGNVIASLLGGGDSELSQKTFDRYEDLMTTMDEVIFKQKELLDTMAGAEAKAKSDEAVELINKQIEATKKLGQEWLNSGSSWKSRSHGYNLRKSLRDYEGAFKSIGIDFNALGGRMEGLFDLSPEQLQSIKEEIPEAWARIDDRTREYLQNIINGGNEIEEMRNQLNETLTGISFDSARDSLEDLLLDADATMADLADNFERYMREAIVGTLIDGPLKAKIQEWYNDFADAMSDGVLDENEKERLQKMYEDIFQEGKNMRDAAFDAAGLDIESASSTGMSGQIARSITEDTASELVGLWNRTALDTRSISVNAQSMVGHLVMIEANTFRTANNTDQLHDIKRGIQSIDDGVKKLNNSESRL
ncbi:MAG: hypothetical protein AB7U05_17225 [Mangrovibacterium sp.]